MGGKISTEEKESTEEEINQMLEKGAIIKLDPSVFEQHFRCFQERWGRQTSDQFKETEQFDSLSSFENGGFISGKGTIFTKRLDVQKQSKGCFLL